MIVFANTVANPWTMMIHSNDAFFAYGTMMDSFLLYNIAFKTITQFI